VNIRRFGALVFATAVWFGTTGAGPAFGAPSTLYTGGTVFTLADGEMAAATPGHLWVSAAGLVLSAGAGAEPAGDPRELAEATRVDVTGKIILPGFVSGHSHLWQSAFRGIAPDGELWPWLLALHRTYGQYFAAGDFSAFTRHGAYDQLIHGVTTTLNHSHAFGDKFDLYIEQFTASETTPQRFVFAWITNDREDDATRDERIRPYLARVAPASDQPLLGLALNAVGSYRGAESFRREIEFATRNGLRMQMHYLEASGHAADDRKQWPLIRDNGGVSDHMSFAHFIHPDEQILREASAAGAAMIWNPLSNGRLGSGLPDIEGYLKAGLKVGIGEDGQASADISDPFENMRLGLYALRMRRQDAKGLQPIDLLRLHTLATARVLGVDRWVGSLEPGKFADFLVVDPAQPGTGPVWDPAAHLLFACSTQNLSQVFVGGREVVHGGTVPGVDLTQLETEVATRVDAIRQRASK
jgi:5-methylthioadenosine/S-adenosylhomocysteine deaminase